MNAGHLAGALVLTVTLAQGAAAAEIRVLSMPGMHGVMDELRPRFEGATGHTLSIQFRLPSQSREVLESGAFDLVIYDGDVVDDLIKQGKVVRETRAVVARMGIGVAVRTGAPKPDISTVEAFKRTMLDAKSISYTRDSGAGLYLADLMARLGIAEEMRPRTKLLGGGGQNPRAVAAGEVELGLSVIGDILPIAGVELLGPLPPELQRYVAVTFGVGTTAREPEASKALGRYLTTVAVAPMFRAKGLEPGSK
jgi:molybdate transport system substrate-binding protein